MNLAKAKNVMVDGCEAYGEFSVIVMFASTANKYTNYSKIYATYATLSEANAKADELRAEIAKREKRNARAKANRQMRDDVMSSLGLTKVRGAVSGRIYYE